MFIAHAPAGYIFSLVADKIISRNRFESRTIVLCGLIFSVLPDFDMLYFYTIDNRQNLHHYYWTHIPIFWIFISLLVIAVSITIRNRIILICGLMLMLQSMIHMALDSVVGGILWLYPIDSTAYALFTVPAQFSHWILNFVFHWTFIIELGIVALAVISFFLRKPRPQAPV